MGLAISDERRLCLKVILAAVFNLTSFMYLSSFDDKLPAATYNRMKLQTSEP